MAETTTTTTTTSAAITTQKKVAPGLAFKRYFTKAGVSPYDELEWELRLAQITDSQGGIIFEQQDVEVPKDWSMTATNIVASKYCTGRWARPSARPASANWWPRGGHHPRLGPGAATSPPTKTRPLPRRARPPAAAAKGGVQLAGMVQRGMRSH